MHRVYRIASYRIVDFSFIQNKQFISPLPDYVYIQSVSSIHKTASNAGMCNALCFIFPFINLFFLYIIIIFTMRYVSNDYLTSMQRNIERSVDKIFTTLIKRKKKCKSK